MAHAHVHDHARAWKKAANDDDDDLSKHGLVGWLAGWLVSSFTSFRLSLEILSLNWQHIWHSLAIINSNSIDVCSEPIMSRPSGYGEILDG